MLVEVKLDHDYMLDSDIDNSQFDNSHNDLDNKESDNYFDYQKKYDKNDKSQPDNGSKYLDNESDINHIDNDLNCNSHSDKHYTIDNKQNSDKKNCATKTKRHTIKRKTRETSKNTIKKKHLHRKLKILDNKSNNDSCIDVSEKINIKIEDFESDSGNSGISNNSSTKEEKAMKIKDICDRNINLDDGIKCVVMKESKRSEVKTVRNVCKVSFQCTTFPPAPSSPKLSN